jgi:hypothetical protein
LSCIDHDRLLIVDRGACEEPGDIFRPTQTVHQQHGDRRERTVPASRRESASQGTEEVRLRLSEGGRPGRTDRTGGEDHGGSRSELPPRIVTLYCLKEVGRSAGSNWSESNSERNELDMGKIR